MFASLEGGNEISLERLYKEKLVSNYENLNQIKIRAKKRKSAYIISGILALFLFFGFAYFFKLTGVFVALIMIAAGYFTLHNSKPVIGAYEEEYKKTIISPITELVAGYQYNDGKISEQTVKKSHLFAPPIKQYASWDLYTKEGISFSFVHIIFDTKENASLERMAKNIFEGYIIMIDKKHSHEGVAISHRLRDKVAGMDFRMSTFFADAKRQGKYNGFDLYGEIESADLEKLTSLQKQEIAISFLQDKTIIALYEQGNPFSVDVFENFDLKKANRYAKSIAQIEEIVTLFK